MHAVYMYILKEDPKELYAFSSLKEYAKRFEEERNMDLFIKKKIKLDDPELMAMQYKQQSKMLQKDILTDNEEDFEVLLTSFESNTLDECCTYIHSVFDMVSNHSHRYPLKEKYLKLIDELTDKITISQGKPNNPHFLPSLNINTLRLFYYLFSKTLHKKHEEPETF